MKTLLSRASNFTLDEIWLPPPGYHFFKLYATTYSLEERVVGELAIQFIPREYRSGITIDKLAPGQLKALLSTRLKGNFCLLYDRSALDGGSPEQSKLAYFAPYLKGIAPTSTSNGLVRFHPKVYWALFRNDSSLRIDRARIVIGSQNLSLKSSCREAGFVLEFDRAGRKGTNRKFSVNPFLRGLKEELGNWDRSKIVATLLRHTKQLKGCNIGEKIEEVLVSNPRGAKGLQSVLPGWASGKESLIISPFVHKNQLHSLQALAKPKQQIAIITRQDSLDAMVSEDEDFADGNPYPNLRFGVIHALGDKGNQDLHAKIYLSSAGGKAFLTIGSSNLTRGGWGRNYELNATMVIRRRVKGFDALWKKLRPFDDERLYQRKGLTPTLDETLPGLFAEWISSWEFSWVNSQGKTLSKLPLAIVTTPPSPDLLKALGRSKITITSGTITSLPMAIPLGRTRLMVVAAKPFAVDELLPIVTVRIGNYDHLIIPDYAKFPAKRPFESFDVEDMLEALLMQTGRSRIPGRKKGKRKGKGFGIGNGDGAYEVALDKVLVSLFCESPEGMDGEGYRENSSKIEGWLERVNDSNEPQAKLLIETLANVAAAFRKRAA